MRQHTRAGENSMTMCQPMVMMLVRSLCAELTSTIGPGSRNRRMLWTEKSAFLYFVMEVAAPMNLGGFLSCDQASALDQDTDGEIVAIDVQRYVEVARVKMGLGGICEIRNLRSCKDHVSCTGGAPLPSLQQVSQMDGTQLVLIRPSAAVQAHRYQRDL